MNYDRCTQITKAGTQCTRQAEDGTTKCWQHQGMWNKPSSRSTTPTMASKYATQPIPKRTQSILKPKQSTKMKKVTINVPVCEGLLKKVCTDSEHKHCMFHNRKCVDKFGIGDYDLSNTKKKNKKYVLLDFE